MILERSSISVQGGGLAGAGAGPVGRTKAKDVLVKMIAGWYHLTQAESPTANLAAESGAEVSITAVGMGNRGGNAAPGGLHVVRSGFKIKSEGTI